MSIVVADNFQYKGGKPLDARVKFASVSDMVGTSAADLYDGCFAYVTGTKKYYSYDSSNALDPTLGKWREFSAGTEYSDFTGATSQDAGSHGLVPAPTTGDISKFLKGDGTWATVPMPSFDYSNTSPEAMNFSTDEKVIGTWIDGKPLYQKTYNYSTPKTIGSGWVTIEDLSDLHIEEMVSSYTYGVIDNSNIGELTQLNSAQISLNGNNYSAYKLTNFTTQVNWFTIQYTKTTDTAVASGEKIVGQWIDGKPVYQKVIELTQTSYTNGVRVNFPHSISDLGYIVSTECVLRSSSSTGRITIPNNVFEINIGNTNVGITCYDTFSGYGYITLKYTKTS